MHGFLVRLLRLDTEQACAGGASALVLGAALVLLSGALAPTAAANGGTNPAPGFRPRVDSGMDHLFLSELPRSCILVTPTVLRTTDGVSEDAASAVVARDLLCSASIAATVELGGRTPALPVITGDAPQLEAFEQELAGLEKSVSAIHADADYVIMLEMLITPRRRGGEAIGGIHCFVLTREGRNVFSFLLNTHHQLFADAGLTTEAADASPRADLISRATRVAVDALLSQIALARS